MMDYTLTTRRVLIGALPFNADLTIPPDARALVVFAHGSGLACPRNRQVALALERHGLGTLLFDLPSPEEALDCSAAFNVELLGRPLMEVLGWIDSRPALSRLPIGLLGASTGAAAAMLAAAARPGRVYAVVSCSGRPDLAACALPRVKAPARLIVGAADAKVLERNRWARKALGGNAELSVVADATHLFEEHGALEQVAARAAAWFLAHLHHASESSTRRRTPRCTPVPESAHASRR